MEEITPPPHSYHYGRLPLLVFDSQDTENIKLTNNENENNISNNIGKIGRTKPFPNNHMFGETRKVSLISLKKIGSALNFPPTRKTSVRSVTSSKASNGSIKSQIRENSGQFDGCNSRTRKQSGSHTRKMSNSTQSRKISAASQRDKVISEIYELEQLKELEFSSSSEDEGDNNNNVAYTEELERQKRVESYINEHSDIYRKRNFDVGDETELTMKETRDNDSETTRNIEEVVNSDSNINDNNNGKDYISFTVNIDHNNVVSRTGKKRDSKKRQPKRYSTMISDMNDEIYSPHEEMTSKRLTRLFLGNNSEVSVNDSFHVVPRINELKRDLKPYLQAPDEFGEVEVYTRGRIPRGSLYSIQSSHSTVSNYSNSDPVPMNFIPGQTKPITRQRSNSLALNYNRIAGFCFKGVMVQIDRSMPKTFKAMAHAGMLSLSITGPSDHRCSH